MEFEKAHNNLRAIRLLYRLLEDNSLALQNANSDDLVDRARLLLKSLLDVTVESVSETHLKILATQEGISKTSIEQEKNVAELQSKSPMAANISQSPVKYPTCSEMTSQKNEQPHLRLLSKKELPELSKFSISNNVGTNSKSLCSLGEENSMMQQNLVKATNLSNEKGILPNTENNNVNTLYGVGEHAKESRQIFGAQAGESNEDNNIPLTNKIHETQCDSSAARRVESPDQKGDFSNDLINAMKRIESRILALQLCSNLMDSTKNSAGQHTRHKVANLDNPVIQRKDGTAVGQLSCGRSLLDGHRLMNQQTGKVSCKGENLISANEFEEPFLAENETLNQSQVACQNLGLHYSAESAKSVDIPKRIGNQLVSGGEELRNRNRVQPSAQNMAMIDRVVSLNKLVSGDTYFGSQASECIQGLRVPLNQDDLTKKPSLLAGQTNRESLVRKNPVAWSKTDQNQKERSPESSYAQKLVESTPIFARRKKPPPHQMIVRPTLLDQRSSEIKVNSHQHKDWSVLERRGTHKTGHAEPRKTRVRPQNHELEESSSNSHPSSNQTSQQGSANSSSDSEDYSLPSGTQGPTSGRMVDASYEGSSEESSNSCLYKDDGPSQRVGSLKSYRYLRKRNPKKTIGGLRRLKNKLGLIFHHHHHHHHHHHVDDHGGIHSKAGHRHSMWNHLQNVFHHKNKHGVLTKQRVEKTRRGAITKVLPHTNQVGQFHRLAEGLVRHIRHSKKPNPSKLGGVKGSRYTPHGHSMKKLHWWQILRRHRGVKLKNRGQVKMGFISQKSLRK
ncbi:uncharacterized protein LOC133300355 [Gastrolobium bilobum]|uniref:uncharacterized protein LOC133300355 n=1 Tax=Gastrolobium bilobum TaxID=150636 RepID=UPI002AB15492|nr:uncharacterized protein LOC133300355 [Gastrolobium bilobum]